MTTATGKSITPYFRLILPRRIYCVQTPNLVSSSVFRSGANPPRNVSGMTGAVSSLVSSSRIFSAGNGFCIAAKSFSRSELETPSSRISHTRPWCSSAAMMLSSLHAEGSYSDIMIGKGGQMVSISLIGVLSEQRSWRSRRRGESKTTHRHVRDTCTSVCHASISRFFRA